METSIIVITVFETLAIICLVICFVQSKAAKTKSWLSVGCAILLVSSIVSVGNLVALFSAPAIPETIESQTIVQQIKPNIEEPATGLPLTIQLRHAYKQTDKTIQVVNIYGYVPSIRINESIIVEEYEVQRAISVFSALFALCVILILHFKFENVKSKFYIYFTAKLKDADRPQRLYVTASVLAFAVSVLLAAAIGPYSNPYNTEGITVSSRSSIVITDPQTPGAVAVITNGAETTYANANELWDEFSTMNTFGRRFHLNYDETERKLLGYAEFFRY